jgi:hypothetical protein
MRHMHRAAAFAGATVLAVLGFAGTAGAQPSYPGFADFDVFTNQVGPTVSPPSTFQISFCGFEPGSPVTVAFSGPTSSGVANGIGCFNATVVVGVGPTVSIDGGPATLLPRYGQYAATATGTNTGGGTQTDRCTFTIQPATSASSARFRTTASTFTGADLAALIGGGVLLFGVGGLVLTSVRRRRGASTPTP